MKTHQITRPDPIEFSLPNGFTFIVQPCTREQMRKAIALDPEPGEVRGPAEAAEQRAKQLAVLVGEMVTLVTMADGLRTETPAPAGPILAKLTTLEEMEMLGALTAQGHGQDPAAQQALHAMAKKKGLLAALSGYAPLMKILSNSPSTSDAESTTPSGTGSSIA